MFAHVYHLKNQLQIYMARNIVSGFAGIIGVIILLFLFGVLVFPALGQATKQDVTGYIILITIVGVILVIGVAIALIFGSGGDYGRGR